MYEGRAEDLWNHTSHILALIANVNRDPKKSSAVKPEDLNPYARRRRNRVDIPNVKMKDVKNLLMGLIEQRG
jgi:hypothetical protein